MADLLASSDEENDKEPTLKINESYAENYNKFRQKEVFQRLKDKYGEDVANQKLEDAESDSDSDESTEDESAEELTEEIEKDFFRTLACLKSKDPRIYDGTTTFFKLAKTDENDAEIDADAENVKKIKVKKEKPLTLGDLERKIMLEKGGQYEEMDEFKPSTSSNSKTYDQELEDIKKSFKIEKDSDDESEDGLLFEKKQKSQADLRKEEKEYKKWLAGQKDDLADDDAKKELKPLRDFWNSDHLDQNEKFLRDYILNKGFKDREEEDESESEEEVDLNDDEKLLAEQEEFEHKYNFRYEEPDQEFIKRFPRTIKDSMRQEENSRKKKREEVKDRKEKEKEKRKEEIKQLKALKRKEIMEKLNKLKKIAGADDLGLNSDDLEEDFDPDKYDKRMNEVFQNYDTVHDNNEDMEKPEFSDLESDLEEELEVENWDEWEGPSKEDNEDTDNEESEEAKASSSKKKFEKDLVESSRKRLKKKSKFAEVVERSKPIFDPSDKTFEQYIDEYYGLEFEDLIGDLPCRFKYRKVEANDFGLSTDEVLSAPDRELNAWCTLRKTCQYRTDNEEKQDLTVFKSKGRNVELKKKILPSLFTEDPEEKLQSEQDKKASKSKKRRKRKRNEEGDKTEEPIEKKQKEETVTKQKEDTDGVNGENKKKKKRRKKKKNNEEANNTVMTTNDVASTSEQTQKQKVAIDTDNNKTTVQTETETGTSTSPKKKKKKKKKHTELADPNSKSSNKKKFEVEAEYSMSNERLKAYGLNPKKLKKKFFNQKQRKAD